MNETEKIRIIVIDDHGKVHRAISAVVAVFDDLELVAHGSNGREAVQLCDEYSANLVLMDVIMPEMGGIEATRLIRERHPDIKILALSSFQDDDSIRAMIEAGAVGYLLKNSSIDDLAHTIRAANKGKLVFSAEATQVLLHGQQEQSLPTRTYDLTARELEVLALMIDGFNNSEIAARLIISLSTVKFHVSSILSKLNVASRVEAVVLAVEQKLTS